MKFNAPATVTMVISLVLVVIGLLIGLGVVPLGISAFYPIIIGYAVLLYGCASSGA